MNIYLQEIFVLIDSILFLLQSNQIQLIINIDQVLKHPNALLSGKVKLFKVFLKSIYNKWRVPGNKIVLLMLYSASFNSTFDDQGKLDTVQKCTGYLSL